MYQELTFLTTSRLRMPDVREKVVQAQLGLSVTVFSMKRVDYRTPFSCSHWLLSGLSGAAVFLAGAATVGAHGSVTLDQLLPPRHRMR